MAWANSPVKSQIIFRGLVRLKICRKSFPNFSHFNLFFPPNGEKWSQPPSAQVKTSFVQEPLDSFWYPVCSSSQLRKFIKATDVPRYRKLMKQLVDKVCIKFWLRLSLLWFPNRDSAMQKRVSVLFCDVFVISLKPCHVLLQIEETSTEVTNRRSKVSFSPKDIDEVVSKLIRRHRIFQFFSFFFSSLHPFRVYSNNVGGSLSKWLGRGTRNL